MCIWLHHQQVCVESLIKVQLLVFYPKSNVCTSSSFYLSMSVCGCGCGCGCGWCGVWGCGWCAGVWVYGGVFVLMWIFVGGIGKGDDGGGGGGGGQ